MSPDYLGVEYAESRRPVTDYPRQLARFIADTWGIGEGTQLLEVASGRAEVSAGFVELGASVTCLDSAPSARQFAEEVGAEFVSHVVEKERPLPFPECTFDVVYSKSFIEHVTFPIEFLADVKRVLRPGGVAIMLTPDWESNYKIFFDDITHKTPFTCVTMRQAFELVGMRVLCSETFRQLPRTWRSPVANALAGAVAPFVPVRTSMKAFRWSRELMICGVAQREG